MSREVVLIVGASTRAMAESAVRAGYEVTTVDYFGDLDQKALVSNLALDDVGLPRCAASLVSVGERISATSVVYGASLENYPEAVSRLAAGRELLGNGPATLRGVRDPLALAGALRAAGLVAPRLLEADGGREVDPRQRWIRKRRRSGGGVGVARWRPGEAVPTGEFIQEFIEGTPSSAVVVADGRRAVVLGLARQIVGSRAFGVSGFRYCGSVLPLTDVEAEFTGVLSFVRKAAEAIVTAFGLCGVFGIDFVTGRGRVYVLEVNPRYTASMELVESAYGLSIFDLHVRACRGSLPVFDLSRCWRSGPAHGKAILFARRPCALGDTWGWLAVGIRDVPRPGTRFAAGAPVCTILAKAPTPDACLRFLEQRAFVHESRLLRSGTNDREAVMPAG